MIIRGGLAARMSSCSLRQEGHYVKRLFLVLCIALLVAPATALSDPSTNPDFNFSRTFEFDPDKTGCPEAKWVNGEGRADSNGNSNFGLVLEKNCPTTVVASAGAVANSIRGTSPTVLGFDLRNGDPCTGGAPRFNLLTEQGTFHFIGGCGNDSTPTPLGDGWTRYRFELSNPGEAFPPVPPGSTIEQLVVIVDEQGQYHLDNIRVDGSCAEKPGQSRPCQPPL
jgi:hypothetical protein